MWSIDHNAIPVGESLATWAWEGNGLRIRFKRLVQVVDVRLVVFVVMELHRLGIDVRFERVVPGSQRRTLLHHVGAPFISSR